MRLETRRLAHMSPSERAVIEAARVSLYASPERGPRFDNKWADSLCGFGPDRYSIQRLLRALECELEMWEPAWKKRVATWRKHPEYQDRHMFRGSQPEDYATRVRKLRRAKRLAERALALIDGGG